MVIYIVKKRSSDPECGCERNIAAFLEKENAENMVVKLTAWVQKKIEIFHKLEKKLREWNFNNPSPDFSPGNNDWCEWDDKQYKFKCRAIKEIEPDLDNEQINEVCDFSSFDAYYYDKYEIQELEVIE